MDVSRVSDLSEVREQNRTSQSAHQKVTCGWCKTPKSIDEFGICRSRRSGRNLYCKSCIREKVYEGRKCKKMMQSARKAERKDRVLSPCDLLNVPSQRVLRAIQSGCKTREQMSGYCRLSIDVVCDSLADLWLEKRLVKSESRNNERVWFAA